MAEVQIRSSRRVSWKRIILVAFLLGFFVLTIECYLTYLQLAEPQYIEFELPAEGLYTDWTSENYIVHDEDYRYFIWQKVGVFETVSSEDVVNELDEWLTSHGWEQSSYAYGFGLQKFDPCQHSSEDVTDVQCDLYTSTTERPLFLCSSYLAMLYTEYMPDLQLGRIVITTTRISELHLLFCGMNYL